MLGTLQSRDIFPHVWSVTTNVSDRQFTRKKIKKKTACDNYLRVIHVDQQKRLIGPIHLSLQCRVHKYNILLLS